MHSRSMGNVGSNTTSTVATSACGIQILSQRVLCGCCLALSASARSRTTCNRNNEMRVCTFMSTDIAARITIQVMSTPRGGRPRGKHQKTLEKERDAAEKKDPALKEARLASVSVLRAQFFGGTARASASTIPATVPATAPADESACAEAADEEHILESSEQPPSAPAEEDVHTDEGPVILSIRAPLESFHQPPLSLARALPRLPTKLADRQMNVLYAQDGRTVRWNSRTRTVVCTCDLDSHSPCKGNAKLANCKGNVIWDIKAHQPAAGKRKSQEAERLGGASATTATAPVSVSAASDLLPHESLGIDCVLPAHGKLGAITMMENGRWEEKMNAIDAYKMICQGLTFPLRPGARWRRTVEGAHAKVAGSQSAVIVFSIGFDRVSAGSPKFGACLFSGGTFARTFTGTSPGLAS